MGGHQLLQGLPEHFLWSAGPIRPLGPGPQGESQHEPAGKGGRGPGENVLQSIPGLPHSLLTRTWPGQHQGGPGLRGGDDDDDDYDDDDDDDDDDADDDAADDDDDDDYDDDDDDDDDDD